MRPSISLVALMMLAARVTVLAQPDPHSFSAPDKAIVNHLDLHIAVDFEQKIISGKATWTINNIAKAEQIILDTKDLDIRKVTEGADEKELKYSLGDEDKILGRPLYLNISPGTTIVNIYYSTSPEAQALQWLNPQQTAGKKRPFLFTQSEPILARTWVPCQDGPGIRFTYNATVSVPKDLMAVMSGENQQQKNARGTYHFKQPHPIPSYLLALAVGDLRFKPIDKRTGIFAEPSLLNKAVWEFADMGKMVTAAEKLYGPYRWGRYDALVLPPSFPFGGMENPNLSFITPTVIAGDRSLVSLIAHELAHSWSGNLVTNATWNDFWLNEGFTSYFERRIVEDLYGKEEAVMEEVLAEQSLRQNVAEMGDSSESTKLKANLKGHDPDDGLSEIPYEKGYFFLRTIENAVGRAKFDDFLKDYFNKYAFQSRSTEQFIADLNNGLIKGDNNVADKIKADEWAYGTGIPENLPRPRSLRFAMIDSAISGFRNNPLGSMRELINATGEKLYFLSHLPDDLTIEEMAALDKEFKFTPSGNAEIQAVWYMLAVRHQYRTAYSNMEKFLIEVGRRKFIVPLYKELIKTPEGKIFALQIYAKARPNYHPVAYSTLDPLLK